MPLSQGPLLTLAIIVFVTEWNEYLWPFLVGRGEEVRVLTVALSVFRSQTPAGSPDWTGLDLMAGRRAWGHAFATTAYAMADRDEGGLGLRGGRPSCVIASEARSD